MATDAALTPLEIPGAREDMAAEEASPSASVSTSTSGSSPSSSLDMGAASPGDGKSKNKKKKKKKGKNRRQSLTPAEVAQVAAQEDAVEDTEAAAEVQVGGVGAGATVVEEVAAAAVETEVEVPVVPVVAPGPPPAPIAEEVGVAAGLSTTEEEAVVDALVDTPPVVEPSQVEVDEAAAEGFDGGVQEEADHVETAAADTHDQQHDAINQSDEYVEQVGDDDAYVDEGAGAAEIDQVQRSLDADFALEENAEEREDDDSAGEIDGQEPVGPEVIGSEGIAGAYLASEHSDEVLSDEEATADAHHQEATDFAAPLSREDATSFKEAHDHEAHAYEAEHDEEQDSQVETDHAAVDVVESVPSQDHLASVLPPVPTSPQSEGIASVSDEHVDADDGALQLKDLEDGNAAPVPDEESLITEEVPAQATVDTTIKVSVVADHKHESKLKTPAATKASPKRTSTDIPRRVQPVGVNGASRKAPAPASAVSAPRVKPATRIQKRPSSESIPPSPVPACPTPATAPSPSPTKTPTLKKKASDIEAGNRLYERALESRKRLEAKKAEMETAYSFQPQVTAKAKKMETKDAPNRFLLLHERAMESQRKKEEMREKVAQEAGTFRPQITAKAKKLAGKSETPRYESLYKQARESQAKLDAEKAEQAKKDAAIRTFKPKINTTKSPTKHRPLYDAEREKQRRQELEQKRLEAEMSECTFKPTVAKKTKPGEGGSKIFDRLYQGGQQRAERIAKMKEEKDAKEKAALSFTPNTSTSTTTRTSKTPAHQRLYDPGYLKRVAAEREQKRLEEETQDLTFKPQISDTPTTGKPKPEGRKSIFERLYEEKDKIKQKVELSEELKAQKELEACTFRPQIDAEVTVEGGESSSSPIWERLAKVDKTQIVEERERLKQELEMQQCTFRPEIAPVPGVASPKRTPSGNIFDRLSSSVDAPESNGRQSTPQKKRATPTKQSSVAEIIATAAIVSDESVEATSSGP